MRKLKAYMFLLIFSLQILPVKEIGRILYNGLVTEEEVKLGCEDHSKAKKLTDYSFTDFDSTLSIELFNDNLSAIIHRSEQLIPNFVPEIFTPPPNC